VTAWVDVNETVIS